MTRRSRSRRRRKRRDFRADIRRDQGLRSKTGASEHHEFDAIPHDQAPVAADSLHQNLATIAAQGPDGRRCQGKNDFYGLTETGERLSEIVKGLVR